MLCAKKAAANIVQAAAPRRVPDRSRSNSPSHVYALISRTYCLSSALIEWDIIIRIKRSSPRGNASCEYFRGGEVEEDFVPPPLSTSQSLSVSQSFNTTSSMGRLTLNVLLSFAQFEREVIGERVRDKIAASRRKGI